MNPDCWLIINHLPAEYICSLIMVKSLVAIRDFELAFCYFTHSHIVFCHPDVAKYFSHVLVEWIIEASIGGPFLLKETSPPTNQRLPRSTIEPWFNNVGGKKLWIVIKHFSLRNTSKNSIIETVLALDRRHILWSSIPRLSLFNHTIVSFCVWVTQIFL